MEKRNEWEEKIKNVLTLECDGLTAPRDLKDRIDDKILRESKEAGNMKKLSAKKLIIGVAAGCLLISGGVFASGRVTSFVTHSYRGNDYRSYSDMDKAQQKLGYTVDAVEAFENGYRFESMSVDDVQAQDQDGKTAYTFKSMDIHYQKNGEPWVALCMEKPVQGEGWAYDSTPKDTRVCGDVTLYYETCTYKFVPPDYELTPEDKANNERADYTISVGSSEVEVKSNSAVVWLKDGIQYRLFGFDLKLDANDMFDMAEEIMGTK